MVGGNTCIATTRALQTRGLLILHFHEAFLAICEGESTVGGGGEWREDEAMLGFEGGGRNLGPAGEEGGCTHGRG